MKRKFIILKMQKIEDVDSGMFTADDLMLCVNNGFFSVPVFFETIEEAAYHRDKNAIDGQIAEIPLYN